MLSKIKIIRNVIAGLVCGGLSKKEFRFEKSINEKESISYCTDDSPKSQALLELMKDGKAYWV